VVIPLWPEGVPGAKPDAGEERLEDGRVYNVQNPTLVYIPPAPGTGNGTAVIACPGGGYVRLALSNEASGLAGRLRSLGVATFILKYRLAEHGYPAPLQDVLRAIRTVRSRAQEFAVRPDRIGIFGASAGGHLAALAATLHGSAEGRSGAAVDAVSARPDFVALLYPVISLKGPLAHAGSRRALLGEHPPAELFDLLSVETHVTSETPPVFMVHTTEDKSVTVENSLVFFRALRDAGVPVELHVYEKGAHGFGMQPGLGPTSEWPRRLEEWMRVHRWLQ
jgi:acetyl esterase/lipase